MEIEERFIVDGIAKAIMQIFLNSYDDLEFRNQFQKACEKVIEDCFKNPEKYSSTLQEMISDAMLHAVDFFKEEACSEIWDAILKIEKRK